VRLDTHKTFTFCSTIFIGMLITWGHDNPYNVSLVSWPYPIYEIMFIAFVGAHLQTLTDMIGHESGYGRRSFFMHSIIPAIIYFILATAFFSAVTMIVYAPPPITRFFDEPILVDDDMRTVLGYSVRLGILAAWTHISHLLLDLVTEGGIYLTPSKRIYILGLPYDSEAANAAVKLLSFALLFTGFYIFATKMPPRAAVEMMIDVFKEWLSEKL